MTEISLRFMKPPSWFSTAPTPQCDDLRDVARVARDPRRD